MKALWLKQPGSLDNLVWGEMKELSPGPGQLLVRVKAVSLNPADYKKAINNDPNREYPIILGLDLAGEVAAVGEGVSEFQAGDRVAVLMGFNQNGSFSEQALVDARAAARIPDGVSYEQAAAVLCAGMTAYEAVVLKLNTYRKQTILIHAGAGGVGGFAIQLAKRQGLKVLTTVSPSNYDWVRRLGADIVIDYNREDVTERVKQETNGRGVDLIVSPVSRAVATEDLDRLAFSGQLAFIAGLPDLTKVKPFTLAPSIHEIALVAVYDGNDSTAVRNLALMAGTLMDMVDEGTLDPMVTEVLEQSQLVDGLRKLQERHVRGKIVVRMS